ncbi:Uncharacterised protein [Mycobacteroides abscessus subsp. abscessus]|nr:Uncharacterised protein [Mycobacteroides abscessus subsp. abscessus]
MSIPSPGPLRESSFLRYPRATKFHSTAKCHSKVLN